jgi:hypothetical protein
MISTPSPSMTGGAFCFDAERAAIAAGKHADEHAAFVLSTGRDMLRPW